MAAKPKRLLTVTISGYGGEHTIGTLTTEQAEYWTERDSDELADHIFGHDDDDMDEPFYIGSWYDIDDVDHTYGAHYNQCVRIKFGDDEEREYKDDTLGDIPMNCDFELYADSLTKETPYLICFSEDKGQLYWGELNLKKSDSFNIEDFVLITKDVFGKRFIVDVTYKGKLLNNNGADSIGKGFSSEIVYPEDLLDD